MAVLETTRTRRHFTADEVLRMVEAGILGDHEPFELLDGDLVVVSPQDPLQAATTSQIEYLLELHGPPDTFARTRSPITATPDSLPEPDVATIRGRRLDFVRRHPEAQDIPIRASPSATSSPDPLDSSGKQALK